MCMFYKLDLDPQTSYYCDYVLKNLSILTRFRFLYDMLKIIFLRDNINRSVLH